MLAGVSGNEWLQARARLWGPRLAAACRAAARVGEFALVLSWLVLLGWQQRRTAAVLFTILVAHWLGTRCYPGVGAAGNRKLLPQCRARAQTCGERSGSFLGLFRGWAAAALVG